MKCPKCHADAPSFATKEGVEMNFCRGCKGLWFDKGEAELYCEALYEGSKLEARIKSGKPTAFPCPHCKGEILVEFKWMDKERLLVDGCMKCHGVFLDAKELAAMEDMITRNLPLSERLKNASQWLKSKGYIAVG